MPDYNLDKKIPEALEKKSQQKRGDIRRSILKDYPEIRSISDKSINEGILNLIKNGIIEIVGYDVDSHTGRMQGINPDYLLFDIISTTNWEISTNIRNLDKSNSEEFKKLNGKIKRRFLQVYAKYEQWEIKKWQMRLKSVYLIRNPQHYLNIISEFLKNFNQGYGKNYDENRSFFTVPPSLSNFKRANIKNLSNLVTILISIEMDKKAWIYVPPQISFDHKEIHLRENKIENIIKYGVPVLDDKGCLDKKGILNKIGLECHLIEDKNYNSIYEWIMDFIFDLDNLKREKFIKRLAKGLGVSDHAELYFELLMEDLNEKYFEERDKTFKIQIEKGY